MKILSDFNNLSDIKILSKYWLDKCSLKDLHIEGDFCFLKTHSASFKTLYDNHFTTIMRIHLGFFLHIVRDPRDVAISYAKSYEHKYWIPQFKE